MQPAERLRHELEHQRARGRPFRIAWPIAVGRALEGEPATVAIFWRITWSEQRRVWAANYSGPNVAPRLEPREPQHSDAGAPTLIA